MLGRGGGGTRPGSQALGEPGAEAACGSARAGPSRGLLARAGGGGPDGAGRGEGRVGPTDSPGRGCWRLLSVSHCDASTSWPHLTVNTRPTHLLRF